MATSRLVSPSAKHLRREAVARSRHPTLRPGLALPSDGSGEDGRPRVDEAVPGIRANDIPWQRPVRVAGQPHRRTGAENVLRRRSQLPRGGRLRSWCWIASSAEPAAQLTRTLARRARAPSHFSVAGTGWHARPRREFATSLLLSSNSPPSAPKRSSESFVCARDDTSCAFGDPIDQARARIVAARLVTFTQ